MGITKRTADKLEEFTNYRNGGLRIAELGDQLLVPKAPPKQWYPESERVASVHFRNLNNRYVCFDIRGTLGAIELDFTVLPNEEFRAKYEFGTYDVVTDYGCLEHVNFRGIEGNWNSFKLMHDLAKEDGILQHVIPSTLHKHKHADWFFHPEFFIELAQCSGYDLLDIEEERPMPHMEMYVWSTLRKTKTPFVGLEYFTNIWNSWVRSDTTKNSLTNR